MDPAFLNQLQRIVGAGGVLHDPLDVLTYECDGLPHLRMSPAAVVLPSSAAEVQDVVRLCARARVPFVPRGHGTGLSGGALPVAGGVLIALSRLNRVLDVDIPNQRVTVEPGVTNLEITRQVAPFGYYYAPDPSSQQVCSIGGNVAENSGGAHCLKYGFTTHHVLGVDAVMPDGELVRIDGALTDAPGPDLLGLIVGSEGTLAIVTSITVRILRRPETVQTLLAAFTSMRHWKLSRSTPEASELAGRCGGTSKRKAMRAPPGPVVARASTRWVQRVDTLVSSPCGTLRRHSRFT